jgi:hypothetical protein
MTPNPLRIFERWDRPSRAYLLNYLVMALTVFSLYIDSWDSSVANISIGVAIGIVFTKAILRPAGDSVRTQLRTTPPPSVWKTIAFWFFLLLAALSIWQLLRGPNH